jgi:L-ascorbate metabolism protein UlaG (beta-lactamase superfamily)
MFEIEYKGANSVIISTKKSKIVIDPNISAFGLKNPSVTGMVELVTEERFSLQDAHPELLIDGPGEYGVSGFDIRGIAARRHMDDVADGKVATIYRIEIDDARIGVIGNVWGKLSDEQFESLGLIDVLILPVGGNGYTLDAVAAAGLVGLIEPKVVIPIHYADSGIKYEVPQGELSLFVSELGAPKEVVSKFKLKTLSALPLKTTVFELERS